jgi:hypothetical protein
MSARARWCVLAVLLAVALSGPAAAHAQDATPTGQAPAEAPAGDDGDQTVALLILAFGAVALVVVFVYMDRWRNTTQHLWLKALEQTEQVPPVLLNPVEAGGDVARGLAEAAPPAISGPPQVVVGRPAEYRAARGDAAASDAKWSVNPVEAAAVTPSQGPAISLTARRAGSFALRAQVDGAPRAEVSVAAIEPPPATGVPLLGARYGGVAIAIVAVTVAAALTALNTLDGAALATLLGTVVAYFFVQRQDAQRGSDQAGTDA